MAIRFEPRINKMDHLDRFTSERIKGRFYQYTAIVLLGIVNFANGGFTLMTTIILPGIENEYQLNNAEKSILLSIYQIGIIIGSILGGDFAKRHGRSISIKIFLTTHLTAGGLIYYCSNYGLALVLYTIYGLFNGFCLNVLSAYSAEIVPFETRGRWMIVINAFLSAGKIFGTVLAKLFFQKAVPGSWKNQIIYLTITALIFYPLVIVYLKESLRYLYVNKSFDQFKKVTNEIIKVNNVFAKSENKTEQVTKEEVEDLQHQTDIFNEDQPAGTYTMLFSKQYAWINTLVWTMWGCLFIVIVGQTIILPYWFSKEETGLKSTVITMCGEIPAIFVGYWMIDKVTWGRKKLLISFTMLLVITFALTLYFEAEFYVMMMFLLARFSIKGAFVVLIPFTAEIYPTKLRSLGLGVGAAIGGLTTCLSSYLILWMVEWNKLSVLVFFCILSFVAFNCCYVLPYDTTGRSLENNYHQEEAQKKVDVEEDLLAKGLDD
jgi:putative MFS transporter